MSEAGLESQSDFSEHDLRTRPSRRDATRGREIASLKTQLRFVEEPTAPPIEDALPQVAVRRVAVVEDVQPLVSSPSRVETVQSGVVSPPPWVRAARRGRWHARFMNAFGWLVTIMVVGSIISVAGRYLAVPPGGESIYTARQ
ncbi:hypothetical protein W911_02785 [Hyphomicrobium nitrativorans NL23]|uniref:Uncharacterized protein n=1 Tax=Hyphomicrobium nitrativorans NL23 TaxID=1029756 RepID=V5SG77_9HYPH|nr:hypothetical protein W911_02785 [Hyphomicrobium nitrativorans NL23]